MRCMRWPTHGSGCGEERAAPEYLELARGGRGRGAGARRRRGAATTRASDRAGAAVLPPPDGGTRRVRAHLLCDHRSEEHTSELQSRLHLVCRLLLEKKKKK